MTPNNRLTLQLFSILLAGLSLASAQQVDFVFPPDLARQGLLVFPIASNKDTALSYESTQSERLESCKQMHPYLIGILNQSASHIDSVVVRMTIYKGSEITRVGINELIFGKTTSSLLILAPGSELSVYLNPAPIPSPRAFRASICSDTARSLQFVEGLERMEITLDSITFADNTLTGEDRYGVQLRSEKRLQALKDIVNSLAAATTTEQLTESMQSTIASTSKAFEASPREPQDFYSRETHRFARTVLAQLKQGKTTSDIQADFQAHLTAASVKEPLKKRTL